MKNRHYKEIQAFVFRLWEREVTEEKLTGKEKELLQQWNSSAEKDIDPDHSRKSKEKVLFDLEPYFMQAAVIYHPNFIKKYAFAVAAAVLLLFTLGGYFMYSTFIKPDIYLAESANKKVRLADGSVVLLLPGSQLKVEKSFPSDTRVVKLSGNAVFSVAKSKKHPFIVQADGFSTKVLGTVFKITQTGNSKAVDLYEGKVAVSYAGTHVAFLKPNQKWTNFGIDRTAAVISYSKQKTTENASASLLSLSFNDVMMKEVAEVLQKSYKVTIIYPKEFADRKITADFTGGDKDENVEALAFILGLEMHKENQTYTLKNIK